MIDRRTLMTSLVGFASAAAFNDAAAQATASAARPGARNLITDVAGLKVGQADDAAARTGVTVILPDKAAVCAVDVRGGGPATRETDALSPQNLVQEVDAIVLSGGSVYGLASGDAVAAWLGAHDLGFQMAPMPGVPRSPIVPTASLYDLANGGNKGWGREPPYRRLATKALEAAAQDFALGTAGAGYGAESGGIKGGVGSASVITPDGVSVGAIVTVNSMGSAVAAGTNRFWAAPLEMGKEFGGRGSAGLTATPDDWIRFRPNARERANTTIACVATDMALTRVEAQRVAMMAQDGLARAIRPIHGPFDGDVVFAVSTARQEMPAALPRQFVVARIGALAADTLARAIARAIFEATAWSGSEVKAWRDLPS